MTKILKGAVNVHREYHDSKEKAVEQSFNEVETNTRPLYFLFFLALMTCLWLLAVEANIGLAAVFEHFGLYPFLVFFIISYFAIFLGSKFLFRPSAEEIADDTSIFAVFSACRRKESRSLISIGLSVFHTLILILYLVSKDMSGF